MKYAEKIPDTSTLNMGLGKTDIFIIMACDGTLSQKLINHN